MSSTVVYPLINNGSFVLSAYGQKADHVRITNNTYYIVIL